MNRNNVLLAAVSTALIVSGCSGAESSAEGTPAPTSPTTTVPSPTATVTVTETADETCVPPQPASINLLARSWDLVVASKGARDHAELVDSFAQDAEELLEDFEDGKCDDTDAMAAAAMLNYNTAVLAAYVTLPSGPKVSMYDDITRSGNKLVDAMGIEGTQFIDVACVGSVDDSPECSSLDLG